jgi:hypothetical protein
MKGLSAKAKDVHIELEQGHVSDAIAYSTVTKDMLNDVILQNELEAEDRAEDQGFSIQDSAILEVLETMPFASICQIAKMTFVPPTTAFRHLTKLFRVVLKRLRWVPTDTRTFRNRLASSCQRSY